MAAGGGGGSKVSRGASERGPRVRAGWGAGGVPVARVRFSRSAAGEGVPACGGAAGQEGSGTPSLLRMPPARDGAGAPEEPRRVASR